ncbi:MAG: tetratricopeptide repeat protein [Xenococcaceae cyanobacterium]
MSESVDNLLDKGLERYQAGEKAEDLIPYFQELCDRAPRNANAWSCLAWLYLLTEQGKKALKAAQKSTKIESKAPQARINLALAMLEVGEKGVRKHIEMVQQIMSLDSQIAQDIHENIEDGLARKPDWENLKRVKKWLAD